MIDRPNDGLPNPRRFRAPLGHALLVLALLLPALLAGCGDDDNPADPGDGSGGDTTAVDTARATIDSLITVFFADALKDLDSAAYSRALDPRYVFEMLPGDDDEPGEDLFWDRDEELRIAGRLFSGFVNPDGQSVESISGDILVTRTSPSGSSSEPDDEEWFDVEAIIDLVCVVNDPQISNGGSIINFIIISKQDFIVARDAGDPDLWVIVQQMDREQINKGSVILEPREPGATEEASWSDIKGLFR